jgi:hypothetical protein
MSESIAATIQPTPVSAHNAARTGPADLRMLAQVEKWMAMIREINREQPAFRR